MRSILGRTYLYRKNNKVIKELHYQRAVARLRYYSAVLVMERFGESMELVGRKFGWTVVDPHILSRVRRNPDKA